MDKTKNSLKVHLCSFFFFIREWASNRAMEIVGSRYGVVAKFFNLLLQAFVMREDGKYTLCQTTMACMGIEPLSAVSYRSFWHKFSFSWQCVASHGACIRNPHANLYNYYRYCWWCSCCCWMWHCCDAYSRFRTPTRLPYPFKVQILCQAVSSRANIVHFHIPSSLLKVISRKYGRRCHIGHQWSILHSPW